MHIAKTVTNIIDIGNNAQ